MRKFLFELSGLIDYCKHYKQKQNRFNPDLITGELRTLLQSRAKQSAKEPTCKRRINNRIILRFDKLPNLYRFGHLREMVKCCIGPLMQLSKAELDTTKNTRGPTSPISFEILEKTARGSKPFTKKNCWRKKWGGRKVCVSISKWQKAHKSGKVPQRDHKTVFRHWWQALQHGQHS